MKVKRCTGSILLMLSLLAVAMAVAGDDVGTIRLPTDAKGDGGVSAAEGDGRKQRPWDCCDFEICTRSLPPICRCTAKVKSCSTACKDCKPVSEDLYVCRDIYYYEIGEEFAPMCNTSAGN